MKLTIVYIIIVLVICYIAGRKKVKNISLGQEDVKPKKDFINGLSKLLVALFVVYVGFMVAFFDMFIVDYWVFFGKKRTAEMENRYGIVVDDDVKLKEYKATAHMEGTMRQLELKSVVDGDEFMRKNCRGELLQYEEYESSEQYVYEYHGIKYYMNFYTEGDSYRVKIY